MIQISGTYNRANVFIDIIDDETRDQIQKMLCHPAFANSYIAIMPDTHLGRSCVIGFTMKMNKYIIPNIVGVDGACGMLSYKFNVRDIEFAEVDNFVKENIPSGMKIHTDNKIIDQLDKEFIEKLKFYCDRIGADYDRCSHSISSLGSGNHFLEIGKDENDFIWVTIHSGSRNFGLKVAEYYQHIAKENLKDYFLDKEELYKGLEWLVTSSQDGQDYLDAMKFVKEYASLNRFYMMQNFVKYFGEPIETIESLHNFIDDDGIIRKGATPANKDQKVIIPLNMRDGTIVGVGKGSKKYNYSAPHGAGRVLSRLKAKEMLSGDVLAKEMKDAGIYTTTANNATVDEAPQAYKDKQLIIDNIKETVDILHFVKPLYNFKAH